MSVLNLERLRKAVDDALSVPDNIPNGILNAVVAGFGEMAKQGHGADCPMCAVTARALREWRKAMMEDRLLSRDLGMEERASAFEMADQMLLAQLFIAVTEPEGIKP